MGGVQVGITHENDACDEMHGPVRPYSWTQAACNHHSVTEPVCQPLMQVCLCVQFSFRDDPVTLGLLNMSIDENKVDHTACVMALDWDNPQHASQIVNVHGPPDMVVGSDVRTKVHGVHGSLCMTRRNV